MQTETTQTCGRKTRTSAWQAWHYDGGEPPDRVQGLCHELTETASEHPKDMSDPSQGTFHTWSVSDSDIQALFIGRDTPIIVDGDSDTIYVEDADTGELLGELCRVTDTDTDTDPTY